MACENVLLLYSGKKSEYASPTRGPFKSYKPKVLDMVLGKVQTVYLGQYTNSK